MLQDTCYTHKQIKQNEDMNIFCYKAHPCTHKIFEEEKNAQRYNKYKFLTIVPLRIK